MKQTAKTIEAEEWVDRYIAKKSNAPTYQQLADGLRISKTAAYSRARGFRDKMKTDSKTDLKANASTRVKCEFIVPNDKMVDFTNWLSKADEFLIKSE
jgi:hypothetical protein